MSRTPFTPSTSLINQLFSSPFSLQSKRRRLFLSWIMTLFFTLETLHCLRKWKCRKDMLVVESESVAKIYLSERVKVGQRYACSKKVEVWQRYACHEKVKVWQRYAYCVNWESESVARICLSYPLRKWKCGKDVVVVSITSCLRGSECRSADWLTLPTQQWV